MSRSSICEVPRQASMFASARQKIKPGEGFICKNWATNKRQQKENCQAGKDRRKEIKFNIPGWSADNISTNERQNCTQTKNSESKRRFVIRKDRTTRRSNQNENKHDIGGGAAIPVNDGITFHNPNLKTNNQETTQQGLSPWH